MIERIQQWTDESDRAVSPVIGVILMVAITVILGAVIGSFVLGVGGDINETPQVRLGVSDAPDKIDDTTDGQGDGGNADNLFVIEHSGGDTLEAENLKLLVNDLSTSGNDKVTKTDRETISTALASSSSLSTGDRVAISEDSDDVLSDEAELRVRIVHEPSDNLLLDTTIEVE